MTFFPLLRQPRSIATPHIGPSQTHPPCTGDQLSSVSYLWLIPLAHHICFLLVVHMSRCCLYASFQKPVFPPPFYHVPVASLVSDLSMLYVSGCTYDVLPVAIMWYIVWLECSYFLALSESSSIPHSINHPIPTTIYLKSIIHRYNGQHAFSSILQPDCSLLGLCR